MRVIRELNETKWNEFVLGNPHANIFHSPEMFRVFTNTRGYSPTIWAVEDQHGQVLALLLLVKVTVSSLPSILTTRAVSFGSVLYEEGPHTNEALNLLLKTYIKEVEHPPLFTELRNLSDLSSIQPVLQDCGFEYEEHLNFLVDVSQPVDVVFQSIGRRTRKNIRRGLNQNKVIVERVMDREKVSACINLVRETYQKVNVPLADSSLFESAFDLLSPKEMIRVTMASIDGQPAATSFELLYKDVIYGWYGGVDRRFSAYLPNELLMWEILKWGAESRYRVYDFGGAGKPDEEYGVRDFKAKFGGNLVAYGRNSYIHRPGLLNLSKAGFWIYQKIASSANR